MSAEGEEMSRHTPGPWRVRDGARIDVHDAPMEVVDNTGGGVALFLDDDPGSRADARLIAAAPDLLSAAKGALAYMSNDLRRGPEGETCRRLRRAIARAEGDG